MKRRTKIVLLIFSGLLLIINIASRVWISNTQKTDSNDTGELVTQGDDGSITETPSENIHFDYKPLDIAAKKRESLPDTPIANKNTLDGYSLSENVSQRISYNYPEDFTAYNIDNHKTEFINGNTQLYFEYMEPKSDSYNGFSESLQAAVNIIKSRKFQYDGKDYGIFTFDMRPFVEETLNGRIVQHYEPKVQYCSNDYSRYIDPTVVIYTTSMEGRGIVLYGISMDLSSDQLIVYLNNIVSTIAPYTPGESQAELIFSNDWFNPNDKSGVSFRIPEGWSIDRQHGIYYIESPNDLGYYDGASIIYYADTQKAYAKRHGSLYYDLLPFMACRYLKIDDYSDDELSVTSYIQEYNIAEMIQGKTGMSYRLVDTYIAFNQKIQSKIPSTGEMIYSYDFEFMSNDVPVMIKFTYTPNNESGVLNMIENILSNINVK